MSQYQHRSTGTKQQNKKFKSKHASKGTLKQRAAGRVERPTHAHVKGNNALMRDNKQIRKNRIDQIRKDKMSKVTQDKFLGKVNKGPPLNVVVVSLSGNVDMSKIESLLMSSSEYEFPENWGVTNTGVAYFEVPRYRAHMNFLKTESRDLISTLDAVKIADILMFCVDIEEGIDEAGYVVLKYIKAQGLPSSMFVLQGLSAIAPKKANAAKQYLIKECQECIDDKEVRVLPLDNTTDGLQILRFLSQMKVRKVHWRASRPYLLVDNAQFEFRTSEDGLLALSGHIRGNKLDPNNLVVIPEFGEFQLEKVVLHQPGIGGNKGEDIEFQPDPSKIQSLERINILDDAEMEQTWPTPEELAASQLTREVVVPSGYSAYQAAWIPEDELSNVDSTMESSDSEDFDADMDVEDLDLREYLKNLKEMESSVDEESSEGPLTEEQIKEKRVDDQFDDMKYPDEVDYDFAIPARVRFQKYRGLKSFRTTPWDPKENLPIDYSKIFQFENPLRTRKIVFKKHNGIEANSYVTLYLKNVPASTYLQISTSGAPLVVGGLMKYENKMSVVNYLFRKHREYEVPVKSKDEMVFHCGFRRYKAQPVFSDHNINCDKFKYRRFLHDGVHVASVYAPISFPPTPVFALKDGELLGTGSVLSIDPDRIILKKIILTGHGIKFKKNRVTVRNMFSNPEDIAWFKPVEIWTKYGRTGNIKESVGTHGNMKCIFDGQLGSQDEICMSLYKRVFPKWAELPGSV